MRKMGLETNIIPADLGMGGKEKDKEKKKTALLSLVSLAEIMQLEKLVSRNYMIANFYQTE